MPYCSSYLWERIYNSLYLSPLFADQVEHGSQCIRHTVLEVCSYFLWACGPAVSDWYPARIALGHLNLPVLTQISEHCM